MLRGSDAILDEGWSSIAVAAAVVELNSEHFLLVFFNIYFGPRAVVTVCGS